MATKASGNGPATTEEKRRIREQLLGKEQAPSSKQQSASFVDWNKALADVVGQPGDRTRIPLFQLHQMRRAAMIYFALTLIKMPLVRAPWFIKCSDPQVAAFVDRALRRIYGRLIMQFSLSFDFGFSAIAKVFEEAFPDWTYIDPTEDDPESREKPVWSEGSVSALIWKPFTPLRPELVQPLYTAAGDFDGIEIDYAGSTGIQTTGLQSGKRKIDVLHALWLTHEIDSNWGSVYGYPRIGYAYDFWWAKEFIFAQYNRSFERLADPPVEVRHPPGNSRRGNQLIPNQQLAFELGQNLRSNATVALPSDPILGYEDRPTSLQEWAVKFVETKPNFEAFITAFEYMDTMTLRSMAIPEQAAIEGRGGTSSRNVAAEFGEMHQETQAVTMADFDHHLNRYVIPDIVSANFADREVTAEKITRGFGSEDLDFAKVLVQLFGQDDPSKVPVNIRELLERFQLPTLSEAEVARMEERELAKAEAESTPPITESIPGQQAGVTDTGFYYAPRDQVQLADDQRFLDSLPKTRHYDDTAVRANARQLRQHWVSRYRDQYEHFARHVAVQKNVSLAEGDAAERAAKRIVDSWRYATRLSTRVLKRSTDLLRGIFSRAGVVELKRANLSQDDWRPDEKNLADFVESEAGRRVTLVDGTVKAELQQFLVGQIKKDARPREIAKAVRAHFADFPDWKADRLVRSEVRDFYNAATLFAGDAAGVKKVQILDSRHGSFDEDCDERNGKVIDLADAWKEEEHPNGTLAFRFIQRADLSVRRVDDMPDGAIDGAVAWFDHDTNTVYLQQDIDPQVERYYLEQVGERLELTTT